MRVMLLEGEVLGSVGCATAEEVRHLSASGGWGDSELAVFDPAWIGPLTALAPIPSVGTLAP